jgi:hypothetical protein
MSKPLVTAIIPTRNRPVVVCRAVRDALGQAHEHTEVLAVIDGPDHLRRSMRHSLSRSPRAAVGS